MPENQFTAEVETLDQLCLRISQLSSRFAGMASQTDTSRAQAGSDSPLSGSALASFGQTLSDALRTTVTLLEQDRANLVTTAEGYRRVDERAANAANGIAKQLQTDPRFPTWTARQSDGVRTMLEVTSGLDGMVAPTARSVRGSIDRVQVTLREDARTVERSTAQVASVIDHVDPLVGLSVRLSDDLTVGAMRGTDEALQVVDETVAAISETVADWSRRADRVLIRPVTKASR